MGISAASLERLNRSARALQAERRLPSLVVAVSQDGSLVESLALGQADLGSSAPSGPDVQYRIGSITKTFTATMVVQLRDEGRLDLRLPLSQGWPGAPHGDLLLADLLCHGSGLQREPTGEVWETLQAPTRAELAENAAAARRLYPPGNWWHYSNLAMALLGELIAQVTGSTWEEQLRTRLLDPLGMSRTTMTGAAPAASGYAIDPYSDLALREPDMDTGGIAPAGQLWSTAEDLCRWSGVLAGCHPEIIAPDSLEEMLAPRTIADLEHWSVGFGLGLMLVRDGDRIYVGHTGSIQGFMAALLVEPRSRLGVVLLTNASSGFDNSAQAAAQLLTPLVEAQAPPLWSPGSEPPARIAPLMGRWWSEWKEWSFSWRDGHLEAQPVGVPNGTEPTRFAETAPGSFVALNGSERGEELRVPASSSGVVAKFYWATYPFERGPHPVGPAGGAGSGTA